MSIYQSTLEGTSTAREASRIPREASQLADCSRWTAISIECGKAELRWIWSNECNPMQFVMMGWCVPKCRNGWSYPWHVPMHVRLQSTWHDITCIVGMQGRCKFVANSRPNSNVRRLGRGQPDLGQFVELSANLEGRNVSGQALTRFKSHSAKSCINN